MSRGPFEENRLSHVDGSSEHKRDFFLKIMCKGPAVETYLCTWTLPKTALWLCVAECAGVKVTDKMGLEGLMGSDAGRRLLDNKAPGFYDP